MAENTSAVDEHYLALSLNVQALLSRLASMQRENMAAIPEGWHMPEAQLDFAEAVLDVFSVPAESDSFCRDKLHDRWMDVIRYRLTIDEFIHVVANVLRSHSEKD